MVQPSGCSFTTWVPSFTIGSMAITIPATRRGPWPAVRHLRVLVQLSAHAVPHKGAHDGKAVCLHILLDGSPYVTHPVSRLRSRDAPCKGFFCDIHNVLRISGNRTARERGGVVTVPAADGGACVDADNIALLQHDML